MTKDNFVVITGGPGAGKTTVLDALAGLGHKFVGETARAIIKERLSRGLTPRPNPDEFARQIFDVDFKNYINHINTSQPVFFDRSFVDSASMIFEADKSDKIMVEDILKTHRFRKRVFIAPPWAAIYQNDSERDQSYDESVEIYEKLRSWYELNDYELIALPKAPVDIRVSFILDRM